MEARGVSTIVENTRFKWKHVALASIRKRAHVNSGLSFLFDFLLEQGHHSFVISSPSL